MSSRSDVPVRTHASTAASFPAANPRTPLLGHLAAGAQPRADFYTDAVRLLADNVVKHLADGALSEYARRILTLPTPALRLYARFLFRRGAALREEHLAYREVPDTDAALDALSAAGMIERSPSLCATALLKLFTRAELDVALTPLLPDPEALRKQPKRVLLKALLRTLPDAVLVARLKRSYRWCRLANPAEIEQLVLAYFGDPRVDLAQFVVEALGITTFPEVERSLPSWLTDCQALRRAHQLHQLANLSHLLAGCPAPSLASASGRACQQLASGLERLVVGPALQRRRQRALLRCAQSYERWHMPWPALRCYRATEMAPAVERRIRILSALDQLPAARCVAASEMRCAVTEQDRDYARSFLNHGLRRPAVRMQRRAVLLNPLPQIPIETYACDWLRQPGGLAWHVENRLPHALAGLLYWSIIYAPVAGAFTHPYQSAPHDLRDVSFLPRRAEALATLEQRWYSTPLCAGRSTSQPAYDAALNTEALRATARETETRFRGVANPLINWHWLNSQRFEALLERLDPAVWATLGRFLMHNYTGFRTGFPDLLLIDAHGHCEFVEIKGPGDTLQPMQRSWARMLAQLGLTSSVLKIDQRPQVLNQ